MELLQKLFDPILLASSLGALTVFVFAYFLYENFSNRRNRSGVQKRLSVEDYQKSIKAKEQSGTPAPERKKLANNMAKKANDFYSNSDPDATRKLQMSLIQAGILAPGAAGYFLAARFGMAALGAALAAFLIVIAYPDSGLANKFCMVLAPIALGYFLPNFYLKQRISKMEVENRQGFPDVLDLMVVSSEAGLTMEASIERISHEIRNTYPNLSTQLNMSALEIRAGRPIDQALRSFGERLKLEEVQGFATMVQQSKELGTSVSDALRVYSDEMRHKRMMKAEEKAYALPAKMSIPVTVFILPIVIGVAIIPTIVRLTGLN